MHELCSCEMLPSLCLALSVIKICPRDYENFLTPRLSVLPTPEKARWVLDLGPAITREALNLIVITSYQWGCDKPDSWFLTAFRIQFSPSKKQSQEYSLFVHIPPNNSWHSFLWLTDFSLQPQFSPTQNFRSEKKKMQRRKLNSAASNTVMI